MVFAEIDDTNKLFTNATVVEREEKNAFEPVKLIVDNVDTTAKLPPKRLVESPLVVMEENDAKIPNNQEVDKELIHAEFAANTFVDKEEI
jgi:hypothetical protein